MDNFAHAQSATKTSIDSAGSAANENAKYMGSLQAKIVDLKAQLQKLANEIIKSDVLKKGLTALTDIVKFFNTDVGQAVLKMLALTTAFGLGAKAVGIVTTKATTLIDVMGKLRKATTLGEAVSTFTNIGSKAAVATEEVAGTATAVEAVGTGAIGASISAGALVSVLGGIAIGGAIVLGAYELYKHFYSMNGQLEQSKKKLKATKDALAENQKKTKDIQSEYDKLKNKKNLTADEKARLDYLKLQLDNLKDQNEELKKKKKIEEKDVVNVATKKATSDYSYKTKGAKGESITIKGSSAIKNAAKDAIYYNQKIKESKKQTDDLNDAEVDLDKKYKSGKITKEQFVKQMKSLESQKKASEKTTLNDIKNQSKLAKSFSPVLKQYTKKLNSGQKLTKEEKANAKAMLATIDANAKNVGSSKATAKKFDTLRKTVGDTKSTIKDYTQQSAKGKAPDTQPWENLKNSIGKAIDKILEWNATKVSTKKAPSTASNKSGIYRQATGGESKGGDTLVNEEGAELIEGEDGAYIANGGQPTIVRLKRGDYVNTAEQTNSILGDKSISGKIRSRAKGTKSKAKKKAKKNIESYSSSLNVSFEKGKISADTYYNKLSARAKKYYKQHKISLKEFHAYQKKVSSNIFDEINARHDLGIDDDKKYYSELSKNAKKYYKAGKISYSQYREYMHQADEAYMSGLETEYNQGRRSGQSYYNSMVSYAKGLYKTGKISYTQYVTYVQSAEKVLLESLQKTAEEAQTKSENMISALSYYAEEQEKSIDTQNETLNTQITSWQKQIDALESANSETEKQNELLEKQQALVDARKEKIKVYSAEEGWHYEQNTKSIKDAQDALESYTKSQELENQKSAIQSKIDSANAQIEANDKLKQQWSDMVSNYSTQQSKLEIEEKLGMTIEQAIFGNRVQTIQTFSETYQQAIKDIISAEKQLQDIQNRENNLSIPSTSKRAMGTSFLPTSDYVNVDEKGSEMIIPPNSGRISYFERGTGIIPANLTSNLMEMGAYGIRGIKDYVRNTTNNKSEDNSTNVTIESMVVKSDDGDDFVRQLKNFAIVK